MKITSIGTALLLVVCLSSSSGFCDTKKGEKINGKKEFEKHCSSCHADGSVIASKKNSAKEIITVMRNPGKGMTRFDEKTISNKEAKAIADYLLNAFK